MKSLFMVSGSPSETQSLGERIGRKLDATIIICLSGELGSGKTSFVQGLARGLDVAGKYYITSPTYSIIHEYPGRIALFHIDLYRLRGKEEIYETGLYEILDRTGIFAIEWPELLMNDLPQEYLAIDFKIEGDFKRGIGMAAHGEKAAELLKKM
jgi:tRNA threonylcarbamoyladenosine biosynthesis protein TsaE